eukprot:6476032-Amphidinium_carterae.1
MLLNLCHPPSSQNSSGPPLIAKFRGMVLGGISAGIRHKLQCSGKVPALFRRPFLPRAKPEQRLFWELNPGPLAP